MPTYKTVGGYINTDPYYLSPEEESVMRDDEIDGLPERLKWHASNYGGLPKVVRADLAEAAARIRTLEEALRHLRDATDPGRVPRHIWEAACAALARKEEKE